MLCVHTRRAQKQRDEERERETLLRGWDSAVSYSSELRSAVTKVRVERTDTQLWLVAVCSAPPATRPVRCAEEP